MTKYKQLAEEWVGGDSNELCSDVLDFALWLDSREKPKPIEKLRVQPPFPDNNSDQNVDIVNKINELVDRENSRS